MYGTPFFDFDFLTETAAALRFTPLWYTVPMNGFGVALDLLTKKNNSLLDERGKQNAKRANKGLRPYAFGVTNAQRP